MVISMQDEQSPTENPSPRDNDNGVPGWLRRAYSLLFYLGLAPLVFWLIPKKRPSYEGVHLYQALTLWGAAVSIVLLLLSLVLLYSLLIIQDSSWADTRLWEVRILGLGRKSFLVWAVFWIYGLWRCLRGSSVPVPFLAWLSKRISFRYFSAITGTLAWALLLILLPFAFYADHQVSTTPESGKVMLLYDDLDLFPRPLFSLAMYPVIRETQRRWGAGSAVLLPLSHDTVNEALSYGKFVFIGSHGVAEGLLLRDGYFRPEDVSLPQAHDALQYVYLAGCDSGAARKEWVAVLDPAVVKTFDRKTPTLEHVLWLWTEGPRLVRALH